MILILLLIQASVLATTECECFALDRQTFNRIMGSLQQVINRETSNRLEAIKSAHDSMNLSENPLLNIKFNELHTLAILGSGTFGRVTLVQHKSKCLAIDDASH